MAPNGGPLTLARRAYAAKVRRAGWETNLSDGDVIGQATPGFRAGTCDFHLAHSVSCHGRALSL